MDSIYWKVIENEAYGVSIGGIEGVKAKNGRKLNIVL
jgi:hypothetical protein